MGALRHSAASFPDDDHRMLEDAERWIVIDGRRWRATDPSIPPGLRKELVDELMARRRAVGAAKRAADPGAEAAARRGVHLAKVALGERGEPWWEPTADGHQERLRAAILTLTSRRGVDRTICPSDAARAVGGAGWRGLVATARDVARDLAAEGHVVVRQRGEAIDPATAWRGPVRIGMADPSPG